MYKIILDPISKRIGAIYRTEDSACIPTDPMNLDYIAYQEWLAEGNTPEEWNPEQLESDD